MAINAAFMSIFSSGPGGGVSPFLSFLGIGKNAEGTDNWRGGPTWVGERGPEIVNLPRGAQVIPNAVASRMGGSGDIRVTLIEDSSRAGQVQKRDTGNGFDITVMVDAITAKNIASPGSATRQTLGQAGRLASR